MNPDAMELSGGRAILQMELGNFLPINWLLMIVLVVVDVVAIIVFVAFLRC